MISLLVRPLSLLLALALCAPFVAAQVVTPANRILVLAEGKSGNVVVDHAPCSPEWSAASDDVRVATVQPEGFPSGAKRSFKIQAVGTAPSTTTITIIAEDGDCIAPGAVEIQVFVVMDTKAVEKKWKSGEKNLDNLPGVNARIKTLKAELKAAEKGLSDDYKEILEQVEAGNVVLPLGAVPPPPGDAPSLLDQAMQAALLRECAYLKLVYASWYFGLAAMASDGREILSYFNYLSFLPYTAPAAFVSGGCGLWDTSRLAMLALVTQSMLKFNTLSKLFHKNLLKLTSGEAAAVSESSASIADGSAIANDPGTVGFSPDTDPCQDDRLQIVKAKAYNSFDGDNENGRILVTGRAASGSEVTVTYQRIDINGMPVGEPVEEIVESGDECIFTSTAPPVDDTPSLEPGAWLVTAVDATGTSVEARIQVPR